MKHFISVVLITCLAFVISCNNPKTKKVEKEHSIDHEQVENKDAKKDCKDVHWSHHTGSDGPENWKNLCDGFTACGGHAQSPINIVTNTANNENELTSPEFKYATSKVNIINNEHTVQFNVDGDNKVILNGKEYHLLQFHYHALSEHTINDEYYPIEVHFVHKHADNDYAVLGVMFTEGAENELFKKYLDKFPSTKGNYESDELINLISLFPDNRSYYHYKGSLTTPPCSEVVNWYVLANPVEASAEQIKTFSEILNNNYRPVMPLNDRELLIYNE